MDRIDFIVDGFNLYHSTVDLYRDQRVSTKWLDIRSLCNSIIPQLDQRGNVQNIYYFSAIPYHLSSTNYGRISRHLDYIKCLQSTGVIEILGRFKKVYLYCKECKKKTSRYEEKETDVAIAVKILELLANDTCDGIVLVSGDTDLVPAIKTAKRLYPQKSITLAFPYNRTNKELSHHCDKAIKIKRNRYLSNQFPNPVYLSDGTTIAKPTRW